VHKQCVICGRFFIPDVRVKERQKACGRSRCREGRKQLAQFLWRRKNPAYFKGRYPYLKEWRRRRAMSGAGPPGDHASLHRGVQDGMAGPKPLRQLTLLVPEGVPGPEGLWRLLFSRVRRTCFVAVGAGHDTRRDGVRQTLWEGALRGDGGGSGEGDTRRDAPEECRWNGPFRGGGGRK